MNNISSSLTIDNRLKDVIIESWQPPFLGSISQWAERNVVLPAGGFAMDGDFRIGKTKYLEFLFELFKDHKIRQINLLASVQCAKSAFAQICLLWTMLNEKGMAVYLCQTEDEANKMIDTRLIPMLKNCKELSDLAQHLDVRAIKKKSILLPNISVFISSPKPNFLQSKSIKVLIGDELHLWENQAAIQLAKDRTTFYPKNHKILFVSRAGNENDQWYNECIKAGKTYEWAWNCPSCSFQQPYYWDYQREDKSYAGVNFHPIVRYEDGTTNYIETAKKATLECVKCRGQIKDNEYNRTQLALSGSWVMTENPQGMPTSVTVKINSMGNPYLPIGYDETQPGDSLVIQYLQAKDLEKVGIIDDFKTFWTQKLNRFWTERAGSSIISAPMELYDGQREWKDETARFMTVDIQRGHGHAQGTIEKFAVVVRAWSQATAESRGLYRGYVDALPREHPSGSWGNIEMIQQKYGVMDQAVFVDSGYNTHEVYYQCANHWHEHAQKKGVIVSWNAVKGDDADSFPFINKDGMKERRLYKISDPINVTGQKGQGVKRCPLTIYSGPQVKDILYRLRTGQGAKWLWDSVNAEYDKQMNVEQKVQVKGKPKGTLMWQNVTGETNDFFDCECMQVLAACKSGILYPKTNFKQITPQSGSIIKTS